MRKYLHYIYGLLTGVVLATVVACTSAGGTSIVGLNKDENGNIHDVPVTYIYTTDGRTLPCIIIENGYAGGDNYSITVDCDWSGQGR